MNFRPVLIFIVIIKLVLFTGLILKDNPQYFDGFWGWSMDSDELSYLEPIDNLLATGEYQPDFRMPGYGVFYMLFRLFLPRGASLNGLIFLQLFVDILSTYFLGKIAYQIFKSQFAFFATIVLYSLSFSVTYATIMIETESLTIGANIISTYFYLRYLEKQRPLDLLWSSVLMTWAIFMRPIVGIFWVIQILYLIIHLFRTKESAQKFRRIILSVILFCTPFVVLDGVWTLRNYLIYKEFIPLMRSAFGETTDPNGDIFPFMNEFVTSWGGSFTWWDPHAEVRWFGRNERKMEFTKLPPLATTTKEFPDYIYTSRFNRDSLLIIRERIGHLLLGDLDEQKKAEYVLYVNSRLYEYRLSIIKEKPFLFYVRAPLRVAKKFIFAHGTANLFMKPYGKLNVFQKATKIFFSALYVSVVIGGFAGIFLIILQGQFFSYHFIGISYILLNTFIIVFVFRTDQDRYMIVVYPFLLLCLVHLLVNIKSGITKKKLN